MKFNKGVLGLSRSKSFLYLKLDKDKTLRIVLRGRTKTTIEEDSGKWTFIIKEENIISYGEKNEDQRSVMF